MYQRLPYPGTKKKYREILDETCTMTEAYSNKFPQINVYKSVYNQLLDIRENIIIKKIRFSEDDINRRYSIGAIAVKNFDLEYDEYAQRLSDIFGGASEYYDMEEENNLSS